MKFDLFGWEECRLGKNLRTGHRPQTGCGDSGSFYCSAGAPTHWPCLDRLDGCEYVVMLYIVIQPLISYRSPDKMGQVIVSRSETCIS